MSQPGSHHPEELNFENRVVEFALSITSCVQWGKKEAFNSSEAHSLHLNIGVNNIGYCGI